MPKPMWSNQEKRILMTDIIQLENKYYISVNSTYADDRVKVLNHADSFGIFDRWGDVKRIGEEVQGIYHNGTRFISNLGLRLNGKHPLLLSSAVKDENEILSVDLPTLFYTRMGQQFRKMCFTSPGASSFGMDLVMNR